jgi:hypothetical protein
MRRGFLAALTWSLLGAALVQAQEPAPQAAPAPAKPGGGQKSTAVSTEPIGPCGPGPTLVGPDDVFWTAPPPPCGDCGPVCRELVWFRADYLLWWVRPGPVAAPLVTTGSPTDTPPGALGQPGTSVLFGDGSMHFGTFNGVRLGFGFDLGKGWGVEGSYFGLERRAVIRAFNSDPNGNPVIARPYFDNQAGMPAAYLDAFPCVLAGGVEVNAQTRLQGYELNVGGDVYQYSGFSFGFLAGFRTLELAESLQLTDNVMALVPGVLFFLGGPADPPNSLTVLDQFRNYNHFYGGQIGGRAHWRGDGLDVGLTAKLALGTTQQLAILNGTTTLNTPGAEPTPNPGGILVQPSNTGRASQSSFGAVPEFALDVGYWITPQIRVALGYQFLYWSRVARPGNEIDTTVNPAQVPQDPRFGNGLGDARPAFQFHQSDFWAQGLNFQVLFQY